MLELEFQYYINHQNELVAKYNGKYVVIVGENVVGVYKTATEAYLKSKEQYPLGTFFIHQVGPGVENYSKEMHGMYFVS